MFSSENRVINAIGIVISAAFVCSGLGLLIAGLLCTYNIKATVSGNCETIYVTGILMTFVIGTCIVFALLAYMVDRCEQVQPPPPVQETPVVTIRVKPKKTKPQAPLSTTNILHKTLTEESARALTQALEKVAKNPMKTKRKTLLTSVVEDTM